MGFFKKGFFKKEKESPFISLVVILAMAFGFTAGICGQIFSEAYLNLDQPDYLYQNLNANQNDSLVIPELKRVKKFLGIQQDFEVDAAVKKTAPAVAGVYLKKANSGNLLNQIYLPKEILASGFILTSDGWLLTASEALANFKKEQLIAVASGKIFALDNMVIDSATGVAFLKIAANNLPVAAMGDFTEIILGQIAVAFNASGEITVTTVKNNNYQPLAAASGYIMSSEQYKKMILLSSGLEKKYLGGPLVNLGGEVIGLIKGLDEKTGFAAVLPLNQLRPVILAVLKNQPIKRPALGVAYLDLAWVTGLSESITGGLDRGALIYQAPAKNTAAALAGLKTNDIIIGVDGQPVDKNNSLTELIQDYQAGDEITLEISRAGKTTNQKVTLKALAN